MKVVYKDEQFSIQSHHEIENQDINNHNIDFWLAVDGKTFQGSAFTLENIDYLMKKDAQTGESAFGAYFWSTNMIILKEMTVECLVKTIKDILNDNALSLNEILYELDGE